MDELKILELFDEYAAEYQAGRAPSINAYLDRAGELSAVLERMIIDHMKVGPTPALAPEALARAEARRAAEAPVERPAAISPAIWQRLLDAIRSRTTEAFEAQRGLFDARVASPVAVLDAALPQRSFGKGVSVAAIADEPSRIRLRLVARHLGSLAEGPVLVLMHDGEGRVLTEHLFERVSGIETVDLDVEPTDATADDVVVTIVRAPAASPDPPNH